MKTILRFSVLVTTLLGCLSASADDLSVSFSYPLSDKDNLATFSVTGEGSSLATTAFTQGSCIGATATMTGSNADAGYTSVSYSPYFTTFTPTTRTTGRTAGHCITFAVTPAEGYTFTPTAISFDAAKVGTDGGKVDVCYHKGETGADVQIAGALAPLRNKISSTNATGYSSFSYTISKVSVTGKTIFFTLYIYELNGTDNENPKAMAFRNVLITGTVAEASGTVKPAAKPLNRGLMALSLTGASMGTGNLVSWRVRATDDPGVKFKLYRGSSATKQTTAVNSGKFITTKTNFLDGSGATNSYYRLEVYDKDDNLLEEEVSGKTWSNQVLSVPLQGGAPSDPTSAGATYTPNDASYCDMDGDGEYEIILKWAPSNEKDAASSGTTSPAFYACYKLDGTRLWMMHTGANMFNSAHTTPFIAWDLDGDGYGEFMVKTAPGAVDGQGEYVLLGSDDPTANLKNSRGKQTTGSEYISVFDGTTGAQLATIPYHTDYATGSSYWGDSNQNRSERYLAALAYLDGPDKNPSPIFARGYYSGAFIGAYDWDGETLSCRWVHRAYSATNGKVEYGDGTSKTLTKTVYGEGAHWISVGDVDGDNKQEIVYGSGCIDDDGTTLYRTGLEHGDALHLGDFDTERDGLEVFMVHEHKPYGMDLRDAKTGSILLRRTADSDTGRGLIGHFDPKAKSAYWQYSASSALFDVKGDTILSSVTHGGGASLNNRMYWNGDLYDDYYDKGVLETYNGGFGRMKVNNTYYTSGTLNNSTKYNPCVLGDLLGDYREEIVTWTGDATNGYSLCINATSYTSNFRLPHLMDDLQYRSQVVNQNCAYNQPPHLSYDPAIKYPKGYVEETTEGEALKAGTYYLRNKGTGKYLTAGNSWGTQAITGDVALDWKLTRADANVFTFDSNISNGGDSHYLNGTYTDGAATNFDVAKLSDGTFTFMSESTNAYLTASSDGIVTDDATSTSSAYTHWEVLTATQMQTQLKTATFPTPQDATYLIADPNFGRNDQRYASWTWSDDCTNKNNSGDTSNPVNYCVESWHSTFTFSQTLTNLPKGVYGLTCQGFYRVDGTDTDSPYVFLGDAKATLPLITSAGLTTVPNNMATASTAFSAGNYTTEELRTFVDSNGTLTIGIANPTNVTDWVIWDNFRLVYYGDIDFSQNNVLDAADATCLANYLDEKVSSLTGWKIADFNSDSKITIYDLSHLINCLSKK